MLKMHISVNLYNVQQFMDQIFNCHFNAHDTRKDSGPSKPSADDVIRTKL